MFDPFNIMVRAIALITAIPLHEAAHAYVADKLGDPTPRYQGRLTLNPMAHFDIVGSIAMILTGIGWAKPVPINPYNFNDSKKGMAITAAAGPISNVLLATASLIVAKILLYSTSLLGSSPIIMALYTIFRTMCFINISLAIFNLIPIPPFDGSRILNYFLPDKLYFKVMEYERYVYIGLFFILFTGVLSGPLNLLNRMIFNLINGLTFFVDIFFKMII